MTGSEYELEVDDLVEDADGNDDAAATVDLSDIEGAPAPIWADGRPLEGAEAVLRLGDVDIEGRMPWSSNATMLATVCHEGREVQAIYKPRKGERPLFDFPPGLDRREVAAFELSEALGWGLIPPTLLRDGPYGEGSFQLFIPAHHEHHYFTLREHSAFDRQLRQVAMFDIVANNTDRKSGHCLLGIDGRIYGIDHGLCFHHEFKLRTVLWDYAGEPFPQPELDDVRRLAAGPATRFEGLLNPIEIDAVMTRARAIAHEGCYPADPSGRRFPWPLV